MTFNFLGPGLTVNVEAKVKEQIILDSSGKYQQKFQKVEICILKIGNEKYYRGVKARLVKIRRKR